MQLTLSKEAKKRRKNLRALVPLVTVHGYKGSVLSRKVEGKDSVVWLTAAQAAGFSTPDLRLPITWIDGVQGQDDVRPMHTMKAVTVIPYLYEADFYGWWLNKAEAMGRPSYEFSYDWRRSSAENVVRFVAYIQWISTKHYGKKIQVLAHSMGAIIAMCGLNLRPELFHSVVFAGGPFRGGPGLFEDLHWGCVDGRNRDIAGPTVCCTFASVYQMAQDVDHGYSDDPTYTGLLDEESKPLPMNWYDVEDWRKYKLGMFALGEPDALFIDHLKRCFEDGMKVRKLLKHRKDVEYPPISIIGSNIIATKLSIMRNGPKAYRGWDNETPDIVPGDGRIPFKHIQPEGYTFELYESQLPHIYLINDPRIPDLLDDLVEKVHNEGSLWNKAHPRL